MKEQLQEALVAVKNGQEERARSILAQLLKEEPANVAGWVLLSKLAQTDVQKVAFLRKVLELDPDNEYATSELAAMEGAAAEMEEAPEPVLVETEEPEGRAEAAPATADEAAPAAAELEAAPEAALPPPEEAAAEEPAVAAPATELPARQPEEKEEIEAKPEALPVSEEPFEFEAQAEGDTLPAWLADDEGWLDEETVESAEEEEAPEPEIPDWLQELPEQEWAGEEEEPTEVPLEAVTEVPLEAAAEVPLEAAAEVPPEAAAAPLASKPEVREVRETARSVPAATKSAPTPTGASSGVIIGLGILLIIIFLILVYVVLSLL